MKLRFDITNLKMQNTHQNIILQTVSKKGSRHKIVATPGSKHKDKLIIQESHKKRQSLHNSCKRNFARISFKGPQRFQKVKAKRKSKKEATIDEQLAIKIEQMAREVQIKNDMINRMTEMIMKHQNDIISAKKVVEQSRKTYLESRQIARYLSIRIEQVRQNCFRTKIDKDDIHFEGKKLMFGLVSQQFQLNKRIEKNRQIQSEKQRLLQKYLNKFQQTTEQVAHVEAAQKDLSKYHNECEKGLKIITAAYNNELSQLFVLRFQLNCNLMAGMVINASGIDKRLMLERDYVSWDRSKQKKIGYEDLKRFILIQLYRGWKNILRKLSYQSSQYQVLFGQSSNQPIFNDLKRFLTDDKIRQSYKKFQKAIIFYSQIKSKVDRKQIIKDLLANFNNGLIQILSVQFVQFDEIIELQVRYRYMEQQIIVQKFVYEQNNSITNRQKLIKDLKFNERRTFCMVEIPLVAHKQQMMKYDQIYELIRKKKMSR